MGSEHVHGSLMFGAGAALAVLVITSAMLWVWVTRRDRLSPMDRRWLRQRILGLPISLVLLAYLTEAGWQRNEVGVAEMGGLHSWQWLAIGAAVGAVFAVVLVLLPLSGSADEEE